MEQLSALKMMDVDEADCLYYMHYNHDANLEERGNATGFAL